MRGIHEFYDAYSENDRLFRRRSRAIERITTMHFLDPYLRATAQLADIGCGAGAYSLDIAPSVKRIFAVDLIPRHISQLNIAAESKNIVNIAASVGSACELSMIDDCSVDIVLLLGPLYHLQSSEERKKALSECNRILKPEGLIFANYINKKQTVLYFTKCGKFFNAENLYNLEHDNYAALRDFDDFLSISYCTDPVSICEEIASSGFRTEKSVALDGIAYFVSEELEKMNDSEWSTYLDYHIRTCEASESLEMSSHGLIVGRKSNEEPKIV